MAILHKDGRIMLPFYLAISYLCGRMRQALNGRRAVNDKFVLSEMASPMNVLKPALQCRDAGVVARAGHCRRPN